jgi:hypothetical protein
LRIKEKRNALNTLLRDKVEIRLAGLHAPMLARAKGWRVTFSSRDIVFSVQCYLSMPYSQAGEIVDPQT